MITVIDVMNACNVEITNELAWKVGAHVRNMWVDENGELPEKRLRDKTAGDGGSHCFAVYPASWFERIATVILRYQAEAARQFNLPFGGPDNPGPPLR